MSLGFIACGFRVDSVCKTAAARVYVDVFFGVEDNLFATDARQFRAGGDYIKRPYRD